VKDREDLLQETAKQNPSTEQLRRVYAPHLSRLTNTRSRVEDLQQAILYHTLSIEQSNRYPTLLEYAANVCDEVDKRLKIDATYLPVVWDAFASYGVIHQDYYAIHLPRQNDVFLTLHYWPTNWVTPSLITYRRKHYEGLEKNLRGLFRSSESASGHLYGPLGRSGFQNYSVMPAGPFIFGPAYLSAVVSNLQSKQPYFLPQYSDEIGHPPDALRYRYVTAILENRLNSNVLDNLGEAVNSYEAHLSILERDKSSEYDSWIEQNLLNAIEEIAERQIDVDLTRLMEETFERPRCRRPVI